VDGATGSREGIEDAEHVIRRLAVQVSGRLVGEHDGRAGHQGSGDGDSLLLPTRKRLGKVVDAIREAHQIESLPRELAALDALDPRVDERQLHIGERCHARDEVERLEHEADLPVAHLRESTVVQGAHVDTSEQVLAGGGDVEAAEEVHQC
jgi:hypothetical protein